MTTEMQAAHPDPYPRKPFLAAVLAFLFGPFGLLYTSVSLSLLYVLVFTILLNSPVVLHLSTSVLGVILAVIGAVGAYRFAEEPPNLSRIPWLAQLDRPGWLKGVLFGVAEVLLLLCLVFFVRAVIKSPASMFPSFAPGEHVVVDILPAFRSPIARGTVVRYHIPDEEERRNLQGISRVVALGGDRIEMKQGLVYVNGQAADSPELVARLRATNCISTETYGADAAQPGSPLQVEVKKEVQVPQGKVFLVSDNRARNVEDSRYFGALPLDQITGVVEVRPSPVQSGSESQCPLADEHQ